LGFAVEGPRPSIAAAAPTLFLATLYLTFSRGALLVLAAGVVVEVVLSPRRLRLVGTLALLVPPCAAAIALAARTEGVHLRLGLLVAAAFLTPLLALRRLRLTPLTAAAAGAYVAFVIHAGLDWDWEVPAVTLAGLACGSALLVAARERPIQVGLPTRGAALAAAAVLAAFVGFTYLGNVDLARGTRAYDTG